MELQRRRAVAWAIALAHEPSLTPHAYERECLERYVSGEVTLRELLIHLDTRIQQVLYRSQAAPNLTQADIARLLQQARAHNTQHDITGLLCFSEGHFIQLLEGPAPAVLELYARIQQDPRHQAVKTLRDSAGPLRWFAEWQMAYAQIPPGEYYWLLSHLDSPHRLLPVEKIAILDPHLQTLLHAFSQLT